MVLQRRTSITALDLRRRADAEHEPPDLGRDRPPCRPAAGYPARTLRSVFPMAFSERLFAITHIGTPVILAGSKSDPWEIVHPGLILGSAAAGEVEQAVAGLSGRKHPSDWPDGLPSRSRRPSSAPPAVGSRFWKTAATSGRTRSRSRAAAGWRACLHPEGGGRPDAGTGLAGITHHADPGQPLAREEALLNRLSLQPDSLRKLRERMHPGMVMAVTDLCFIRTAARAGTSWSWPTMIDSKGETTMAQKMLTTIAGMLLAPVKPRPSRREPRRQRPRHLASHRASHRAGGRARSVADHQTGACPPVTSRPACSGFDPDQQRRRHAPDRHGDVGGQQQRSISASSEPGALALPRQERTRCGSDVTDGRRAAVKSRRLDLRRNHQTLKPKPDGGAEVFF